MIHPDDLRQLGWSEELISEVTRVAEYIRAGEERVRPPLVQTIEFRSGAGDSIHLDQTSPSTSSHFLAAGVHTKQ